MKLKEHTRNQKRMYRIHKQDDKIHDLELMISKLQQENKQLKNNWNKLKELFDIQKENEELKEQLEKYETYFNRFFKLNNKTYDGKFILELLDKKETQQKKFIKYLEDEINNTINRKEQLRNNEAILVLEVRISDYNTILQKYKEIIGVMKNEF